MNRIRESMGGIRAAEELKSHTLQYLEQQRHRRVNLRRAPQYVMAAICLFLLLGVGGYIRYNKPVSYISMDVNPSIELAINRYGKVISAEAYNRDGQNVLQHLSLKNRPYVQAIRTLLEDEISGGFLTENATLVFTIISDSPDAIREGLDTIDFAYSYQVLTYISDRECMQEAHQNEMSFGKYRACLELTEYDQNLTIEDCHDMTMGEIQDRIEGCRQHGGAEHHGSYDNSYDGSYDNSYDSSYDSSNDTGQGGYEGHHGHHGR